MVTESRATSRRSASSPRPIEHKYAIVTGQGRSGTNWLLDVLDASPSTFCRNEPNGIVGSPFGKIPALYHVEAGDAVLDAHWDEIAHWTCSHMGERDHPIDIPKSYIYPSAQHLGLTELVGRNRRRAVLARVMPSLRKGEWEMPAWIGNRRKFASAYGVIKINRISLVAAWVMKNRPEVPVINILRHPGGRHASFLRRFVAKRESDEVLRETRRTLHNIAASSERWSEMMGPLDELGHAELQTWFWRYVSESMEEAAAGHPQYHRVIYEDMTRDPMHHAQKIYDVCGLPWTADVEKRVEAGLSHSVWGRLSGSPEDVAKAWRTKLDRADIDAIERILESSPLASYWT